jgi:hypothetical protein
MTHISSRSVFASLVLAAAASAQSTVTSPRGYDATEGEQTFVHFTTSGDRRFQQIDATHVTNAFLVNSLGWRRNGTGVGGGTNAPPRTMDLEVTMGVTDMTVLTADFDPNYLPGSRQIVFTKKPVSMPDWSGIPSTPAPFDFVVALDTPFPYTGSLGLVIDFTYENLAVQGSTGSVNVDRAYVGALTSTGSLLGAGCVATGRSSAFSHTMRLENNGPNAPRYGMRLRADGTNAPSGAPVLLNIDFADQNLNIPGVCTTLHASPSLSVLLGVSSATGVVPQASLSFPHTPSFLGATVVTQLVAPDAGAGAIPAVLSNGRRAAMPNDPAASSNDCVYHWTTLPSATGTLFFGGGMALQLGI